MTCAAWGAKGEKPIRPGPPSRWELEKEQRLLGGSGPWTILVPDRVMRSQQVLPLLTAKPIPCYSQGLYTTTCLHSLPASTSLLLSCGHKLSCPKHHFSSSTFWPPSFGDSPSSTEYTADCLHPLRAIQDPHNLSRLFSPCISTHSPKLIFLLCHL